MDINSINFGKESLKPDLFSDVAEYIAKLIKCQDGNSQKRKKTNKNSQIRKFYDELVMWNDKVQRIKKEKREEKFLELEPFIKMLKAKVAYAEARKHVDADFSQVFNRCIDQINSAEQLKYAKLFFEAVMGFCKIYDINEK